MKRIASIFLLALLVGGLWASSVHARASYGGDCMVCHNFSNQPPVANAGPNQTVVAGVGVTLGGAASTDPDDGIASYAWKQTAGTAVTLTNANTVTAKFTAPNVTTSTVLTFQLTVTDRRPQSATDTVNITVTPASTNRPPTANAGPDRTVSAGAGVTLSGAASTDPDDGIASYAWTQISGTTVTLANVNTVSATFTAPNVTAATALTFQLTVRDRANQASTDTIVLTVNPVTTPTNRPPTANAGPNQAVASGARVTLNGATSTDPDDGIASYAWTQTAGSAVTLSSATAVNPTFTAPQVTAQTTLTFSLTVTDRSNAKSPADTVNVVVSPPGGSTMNRPPIARAGRDLAVLPGTLTVLEGFYSTDPDNGIASYSWTQTAGPAVTLSNQAAMDPIFQAPSSPTTLTFTLVVTDKGGLQSSDTVNVVVLAADSGTPPPPPPVNKPPVAKAGADQSVRSDATVRLSAAASTDPDDGIASYQWRQTAGIAVRLYSATSVTAAFVAPEVSSQRTLTFQLTVKDKAGQSSTDTVNITVNRSSSGEEEDEEEDD